MKLLLRRIAYRDTYTIGRLFLNGRYFCDTLEDAQRPVKIKHQTCIPDGVYKIVLRRSKRFRRILPALLDVPNFNGILIHAGNTHKDTSGCILVGENKEVGKVLNSTATIAKLMPILKKSNNISIEII